MNKLIIVNVIATILSFSIAIYGYTRGDPGSGSVFLVFGVIYLGLALSSIKK